MLKRTRLIGDLLTQARALLAIWIVGLGIGGGRKALPQVALIVLVSWITDLIDGPLARRDPDERETWVGRHDAEADLATSVGLCVHLTLAGYVAPWVGLAIVLLTVGLWVAHSPQLSWPFYALPYAILTAIGIQARAVWGWALLLYLVFVLGIRWHRLKTQYLPEFFSTVKNVSLRRSRRE